MNAIKKSNLKPLLLMVIMFLFVTTCKKDDNNQDNQNNTPAEDATFLKSLSFSTGELNKISVFFQAVNVDDQINTSFDKNDFTITENGSDISENVEFSNSSTLNVEYKTLILVDVTIANTINIPDIKFALKAFINKINPREKMAIYTFSGEINKLVGFTNNKTELKNAVEYIAPEISSRNLYQALTTTLPKFTLNFNPGIKYGSIVLITGGNDNTGLASYQDVINKRGEKTVYTFNTKVDSSSSYNEIKEISNGLYTEISTISELASNMLDLHNKINRTINNFYKINYTSFTSGNVENKLKIVLQNGYNSQNPPELIITFNSEDFIDFGDNKVLINDGTNIILQKKISAMLTATPIIYINPPDFQWTSSNPDIIKIVDYVNDSSVKIKAVGEYNDSAVITVQDLANNVSGSVTCYILLETDICYDSRDGQSYNTVKIGDQWWLAENMNYETENSCYYDNDSQNEVFGRLYNFDDALNACPEGWHLPSDDEWKILEGYVDSTYNASNPEWNNDGWRGSDAGGNLKSLSELWDAPNYGATDNLFFSALPGGILSGNSLFIGKNTITYFWTRSSQTTNFSAIRVLINTKSKIMRNGISKQNKLSVRCVKD